MIEKITLENFQSHKKTEMEFGPGVNVIVGPSDSGKTAIIRALRWLVWNRPSGDAFISHWADSTKVSVQIDGKIITREKTKTENKYLLDTMIFNAVKTDVPIDVQTLLNLGEINIQQQLDRPFLLDATPGEVASHFNKIAHLDVIDTAMKNILQWTRKLQQDIANKEDNIKRAESEEHGYAYLEDMEMHIVALEQTQQHYNNIKTTITSMTNTIDKIQQIDKEIETYNQLIGMEPQVEEIIVHINMRDETIKQLVTLNKLVGEIQRIEDTICKNKTILKDEPVVEKILVLLEQKQEKTTAIKRLSSLVEAAQKTAKFLADKKTELNILEKRFHKEFPDICPLCGQKVVKGRDK